MKKSLQTKDMLKFPISRKLMMIAATVAALGGTGGGAALAATSPPAAAAVSSVPRCYPQDLSASLHGLQLATGDRGGFVLTLTILGGTRACSTGNATC